MADEKALGLSDTAIGVSLGNVLGLKLGEFDGLLEGEAGDPVGGFVTRLLIGGTLMVGEILGDRVDSSQSGLRQTNSPFAAGLPVLVVSPLLVKCTSTKLFVTLSMRRMESTDQQPS